MRRLPPLKSLLAFEAAARHLSFKKAAEELHVTPTAVSHQIRTLEDWLEVKLFHRLTRSLALTQAGKVYAPLIQEGFDNLAAASEQLQRNEQVGELAVSTTTSLATKWLGPRLHKFAAQRPEIIVRLHASDAVVDFARQNFDVAIRYGRGEYPDLYTERLFEDVVAPICSPALLRGAGNGTGREAGTGAEVRVAESAINPPALRTPADLRHHTLIHYEWSGFSARDPSWPKWLQIAGVENIDIKSGPIYSEEHMCIQAAIDGHGVALCSLLAAAADLEAGTLVQPFDILLPNFTYYLVCPRKNADQGKIVAFRDWLLEEVQSFAQGARHGC